jgi:hypothetical protein
LALKSNYKLALHAAMVRRETRIRNDEDEVTDLSCVYQNILQSIYSDIFLYSLFSGQLATMITTYSPVTVSIIWLFWLCCIVFDSAHLYL